MEKKVFNLPLTVEKPDGRESEQEFIPGAARLWLTALPSSPLSPGASAV